MATATAAAPPQNPNPNPIPNLQPSGSKRKRNLPGTPDPEAEVIALSPNTLLLATTFVCDVCGKEFRRDQNLQIHRRGHNLPWKFSSRSASGGKEVRKKVYICPAEGCVYHDPSRALGDLTGIKKHYCRKHGEKRWECGKCDKKYAVKTDWKAHVRVCGSREYECACGTLFARKYSYVVHRSSCAATEEEAAAEEEEDDLGRDEMMAKVDLGSRASMVNTELLFPSLWGRATATAAAVGDKDKQRERMP